MREVNQEQVAPIVDDRIGPYVGLTYHDGEKVNKMVLKDESNGYIFREIVKSNCGHSGHSDKRDIACYRALRVKGTKVFEFETQYGLDCWLKG